MTTFTQLTEHLWVQQSELYFTNSGVFISQEKACLIDPCVFPHEIKAMVNFIAKKQVEPELLILTHSHWDHILGAEYFPEVKILAQANYLSIVAEYGDTFLQQIAEWETHHQLERKKPFVIPQPDQTFEQTINLTIGAEALQLIHVPGHAADQLAIYHAPSGLFWASDILSDVEIPFISDSLDAFEDTLARLATLEIKALVPGHGNPTTDAANIRARLTEDSTYLATLREWVRHAIDAEASIEETITHCAGIPYRLPQENSDAHRLNVESIYLAMGGKADAQNYGWGKG